jgi:hypothetical protein
MSHNSYSTNISATSKNIFGPLYSEKRVVNKADGSQDLEKMSYQKSQKPSMLLVRDKSVERVRGSVVPGKNKEEKSFFCKLLETLGCNNDRD